MNCWKCQKSLGDLPTKIGFRAVCIHCDVDLHVCKNCRYFSPGKPNDCIVPGTELVQDKERSNLCEEFKPKTIIEETSNKNKARELFGDEVDKKKPNFNDLFE